MRKPCLVHSARLSAGEMADECPICLEKRLAEANRRLSYWKEWYRQSKSEEFFIDFGPVPEDWEPLKG